MESSASECAFVGTAKDVEGIVPTPTAIGGNGSNKYVSPNSSSETEILIVLLVTLLYDITSVSVFWDSNEKVGMQTIQVRKGKKNRKRKVQQHIRLD